MHSDVLHKTSLGNLPSRSKSWALTALWRQTPPVGSWLVRGVRHGTWHPTEGGYALEQHLRRQVPGENCSTATLFVVISIFCEDDTMTSNSLLTLASSSAALQIERPGASEGWIYAKKNT